MTVKPKAKKRPILLIIIATLAGLCIFCIAATFAMDAMGLLPTSTPAPRPSSTQIPTIISSVTSVVSLRCNPATPQQVEIIRAGVKDIDANNDVQIAWSVKSNDFENVWFVAAEIQGTSIQPGQAIGVWAISGDPSAPGIIVSVDGFAKQFSTYPDGSKSDANTTMTDDGAQESLACFKSTISSSVELITFTPISENIIKPTITLLPTRTATSILPSATAAVLLPPPSNPSLDRPAGTSGRCVDGSYTSAQHKQGACSHHGGVSQWWGP